MTDWKGNKGVGPWDFTEQPNKWGYLNNPRWSNRQDSVDFCGGLNLPIGSLDEHTPCGHWHKIKYFPITGGKWVAAMQQPGTPYIYVYDIEAKAVIRINTSIIPVIVDGVLKLNSAYALDYDMGWGNPGAQRGGYCMNKDGTKIWYLFCDQGQYPITRDHPDAELIEVNITSYYMKIVKRTTFPNLLPAEPFPDPNWGRINDGCSDDTYTYWCTDLVAGRIIKIRNSDHIIVDDHYFNYPIEDCSGGGFDEAIATIDVDKNNGKLYWAYCRDHLLCVPAYNTCRHLIRADLDLVADIDEVNCGTGFGTPSWQNMIRIYANHVLHHRGCHPLSSPFMKRTLGLSKEDTVAGTLWWQWTCIKDHVASVSNRPQSGVDYTTYWGRWDEQPGGNVWQDGKAYHRFAITQEYLQNIFGVKNNYIFTLMHVNSLDHPARLYCINFSGVAELSNLDISYYTGQSGLTGPSYDWDWTSVSALNQQTGVIAIFRYNNSKGRNYAACFDASPSLSFLCDTRFERVYDDPTLGPFGEPQSWPFEGFTPPEIPEEDPPVEVIVPPGGSPGPGEIPYEPPPPPPDDAPNVETVLTDRYHDYMYVGPGQTLFFKFVAAVADCHYPIQVGITPAPPYSVHGLVKRGSRPTIADFERTWTMPPSRYYCDEGLWGPSKDGVEDLYWKYNIGSPTEFIEIGEPMGSTTFYIMLYNNGRQSIRTRLTVVYYA